MPINSRSKGARGEREWRDELRAQGYLKARRGQQFAGGPDSPDVVCEELAHIHFEVKRTERLNIYDAYGQAKRDAGGQDGNRKTPVVAHKRNHGEWLVVMSAEAFFNLIRKQSNGMHPLECRCKDCSPCKRCNGRGEYSKSDDSYSYFNVQCDSCMGDGIQR